MRKTTTKLTEAQRDFAAVNHYLVNEFLRENRLSEDYYDVVIFRYLHAAQLYDERPELKKYSFKTIAFWNMQSALSNHNAKQQRAKRNAEVISLEAFTENGFTLSGSVHNSRRRKLAKVYNLVPYSKTSGRLYLAGKKHGRIAA